MPDAARFVVQEHWARSHHFDFRLEVDGVLRSWAVPKGPPEDPAVKRLAVQVPDHDLAHADHESDSVEIWDRGTYVPDDPSRPIADQLDAGHATVWLDGARLHGRFTLQRTSAGDKPQWLLLKRP